MKKLIFLILPGLMTMLVACHSESSAQDEVFNKSVITKPNSFDTVKINYQDNKTILDILPLLPDSAMRSWEWSKVERQNMVNSIKRANYFIDRNKDYNTIKKVLPHYFITQVVDGTFSVACYKVSENISYVITNDVTGDSNYIQAYQIENEKLNSLNTVDLLGSYFDYFFTDPQNANCKKLYNPDNFYQTYSFEEKSQIKISALFTKKNETCLKGNLITLKFNTAIKKFELVAVQWGIAKK